MNEILWLSTIFLTFGLLVLIFRFSGLVGLYVWIVFATLLANLQVIKFVQLFGVEATLGNILYGSCFFASDLISERYGKKEAKRAVYVGLASLVLFTLYSQLTLLFQPSAGDLSHDSLKKIFSFTPRLVLASFIAFFFSQIHDVFIYHYLKSRKPSRGYLWLRNNLSTLISQLIDTALFVSIAFLGFLEGPLLWQIFLSTYVLKLLVSLADTPFLYIATRMQPYELLGSQQTRR